MTGKLTETRPQSLTHPFHIKSFIETLIGKDRRFIGNFSICNKDKNVSSKLEECLPSKNLSTYEEIMASFHDDGSKPLSPDGSRFWRWSKFLQSRAQLIARSGWETILSWPVRAWSYLYLQAMEKTTSLDSIKNWTEREQPPWYDRKATNLDVWNPVCESHHWQIPQLLQNFLRSEAVFLSDEGRPPVSRNLTPLFFTFKRGERSTIVLPEENELSNLDDVNEIMQTSIDKNSPYRHQFAICVIMTSLMGRNVVRIDFQTLILILILILVPLLLLIIISAEVVNSNSDSFYGFLPKNY